MEMSEANTSEAPNKVTPASDFKRPHPPFYFPLSSALSLPSAQLLGSQAKEQYRMREDAFINKIKHELISARDHPTLVFGIAIATATLLLRGPRKFLFRHTIRHISNEEAHFARAQKRVQDFGMSVALMKKDGQKLLQRAFLAEDAMRKGSTDLRNIGSDTRKLLKLVKNIESQAAELMDELREIPGREMLKLRAEVASMSSLAERYKSDLCKRILRISDRGISV